MTPTIDPEFAQSLLRTFNSPNDFPVHLLFNEFWKYAAPEVVDAYEENFSASPHVAKFVEAAYYADPLSIERLEACADGSLGAAAHAFITDNNLEEKLATNYRLFHEALETSGMLDGMPEALRYAVLRGFQLHDLIHVVTGYGPSPIDEIALQAFCLAQLQFPYFAMWIAVVTTRMTLIAPESIVGLMDAISAGWQFGRSVDDLQMRRLEDHLDDSLADLRRSFGIDPAGRQAI